jgi:hypothetical protein
VSIVYCVTYVYANDLGRMLMLKRWKCKIISVCVETDVTVEKVCHSNVRVWVSARAWALETAYYVTPEQHLRWLVGVCLCINYTDYMVKKHKKAFAKLSDSNQTLHNCTLSDGQGC